MSSYRSITKLFLESELSRIKKTRNILIAIFTSLFTLCYGFFLVGFFQNWLNNEDRLSFFYKSLPTLSILFICLSLFFGPLCWITFSKNQKFIHTLRSLNEQDLEIYRKYTSQLVRAYATIAPYLFRDKKILLFTLFGHKLISINQIHRIETKIVRNYRGPNSFRIYFYTEFSEIHQVTTHQLGAFTFMQEHLKREIPDLIIISGNR